VMEVFSDGSARVCVESGRDVALNSWQIDQVEPGEAGWLLNRGKRGRGMCFVKRER
jgi:hypothetical protein